MKLQSLTLLSVAATALAVNLEQIRLINEDALVLDGTQFDYPVLGKINEQDEFKDMGKKKAHKKNNNKDKKKKTQKKEKKTTKTTLTTLPPSSTPSLSFTKVTSTKHSSKTSSETTTTTSSSKHESSSKSHSHTASITKTNGGDSVVVSIGGPIALALGLLL
ncbi:uncharacterized protein SPAPADRAFT_62654 [Spathaspora passalidarum NRRL Y-27907]|uniref:Uncharacterized protein n=1 Tax=Spathaspora passalidarum (strain NRRL Y-27907 / 11-Y1) TaxID=619300 RepID=G3AT31_SPAPN|nr:uncharacterized protein SPAPADRAFT_62654 [Spathaspora passalidarum NRRL Y-27907]EGW30794.1 hypothetical protein SPAPADRAFT_62654 [Spathaspora passalidarum NRRL Y-27907]